MNFWPALSFVAVGGDQSVRLNIPRFPPQQPKGCREYLNMYHLALRCGAGTRGET